MHPHLVMILTTRGIHTEETVFALFVTKEVNLIHENL